ncbi:hypothetical protein Tco_0013030, partial [Tanacetum coccineum]
HVKRGRDTKIPQSSGPPVKVGDEVVHKELGDIMERVVTTASSLEAEQDSDAQTRFKTTSKQSNDPPLSRVNTLRSREDSLKLIELMAHYTTLSALDEVRGITATIDRKVKVFVSKASIRIHLKLEDSSSHGWKFFIHTILHCLSPKKTAWEQFSSNIATAIICLAIIVPLTFPTSFLRPWVDIPLFPTMLIAPESSPSRITSSPSLSPQTHPSTSQPPSTPQSNQTTPVTEDPMPYESPLQSVYSLGHDEGSLSLTELTDLCTLLSKKVESLESKLNKTKQTYHAALTKLIKRVK